MPISKSRIEAALKKLEVLKRTEPKAEDPIRELLGKISLMKGEKGDPAYTPVKGVDYFTEKEIGSNPSSPTMDLPILAEARARADVIVADSKAHSPDGRIKPHFL